MIQIISSLRHRIRYRNKEVEYRSKRMTRKNCDGIETDQRKFENANIQILTGIERC